MLCCRCFSLVLCVSSALTVTPSKDVSLKCKKAFYGEQKFLRSCGPSASRFHLISFQFRETCAYYTDSDASTYKCAASVKNFWSQRNDNLPVKFLSSLTLDFPKKIVSLERALFLSIATNITSLTSSWRQRVLNVVCTIDLIKALLDTAQKLSEDVALLKSDNASYKFQINKLNEKAGQAQGSLSSIVGL